MKFTVQKFAKAFGVTSETIRHYRQLGLLKPETDENGYYFYSIEDVLTVLMVKELRSYDMNLHDIKSIFENPSESTCLELLKWREEHILTQIRMLQLELERIQESKVYAGCMNRLKGRVEEFDGPATWAVGVFDPTEGFTENTDIEQWIRRLPFTYISATITEAEMKQPPQSGPYNVHIGSGSLIHYVDAFKLPLDDRAFYQPAGHFIRTCIATNDPLALEPKDLELLYQYAEEHKMTFASCSGGRLLFIEKEQGVPIFHLLVWIRVVRQT